MPNYQNSRIFCIRSHQTDDIFIGSTVSALSTRLAGYRKDYRYNTSYIPNLLKNILNYDDAYIELIEAYPCNSLEQLKRRQYEITREYYNQQQKAEEEFNRLYNDAIDTLEIDTDIETKCLFIDDP